MSVDEVGGVLDACGSGELEGGRLSRHPAMIQSAMGEIRTMKVELNNELPCSKNRESRLSSHFCDHQEGRLRGLRESARHVPPRGAAGVHSDQTHALYEIGLRPLRNPAEIEELVA